MISICIPVYNFDVTPLVTEINSQIRKLQLDTCELILIDDASTKVYNKEILEKFSKYIELKENVGRSCIRNLFLKYASQPYILFLDCDSIIDSDKFLKNYLDTINESKVNIVCGGRVYPNQKPAKENRLRWKYGIDKESKTATERRKVPNQAFMTNNFLIAKDILQSIPFNENLTNYGHEDTLLGYHLEKESITINHIDNPVLNGDIEPNHEFIRKTEEGILNLSHIWKSLDYSPDFASRVSILRFYNKVRSFKLKWLVNLIFWLGRPFIKSTLEHGYANLLFFDFYKLGLLTRELKNH